MSKKQRKPFSASENHSYNVNVALALGKPGKAVLLKELYRSYKYFKEHNAKEVDGFHWFFLKMDALSNLYPEYTKTTMYRWLSDLEKSNLIASRSDLNGHKYDRTKWFTVNVFAYEFLVLGNTLNYLNSQNENSKNKEHSNWIEAITKMRIANKQSDSNYYQSEPTIQPCLNPCEEPCLNPGNVEQDSTEVESVSLFDVNVGNYATQMAIPELTTEVIEELSDSLKKEKTSGKKEQRETQARELIKVLNDFASRQLPYEEGKRGASTNVGYVVSLLKKNYTFDELELMIQYKCFEWVGTDSEKYLRPITLFHRHGERYVQEAIEAKNNPRFLEAVRRHKEKQENSSQANVLQATEITKGVAEELQNW